MSRRRFPVLCCIVVAITFLLGFGLSLVVARPGQEQKIDKLKRARVKAAARAYAEHEVLLRSAAARPDSVYRWSVRWYEAQGDATKGNKAATAHLKRMRALHATIKKMYASGTVRGPDLAAAGYYLAEARVWAVGGRGR